MLEFRDRHLQRLDTHHAAGTWTQLKAAGATSYAIPMRGTADNTANSTLTFRMGAGTANVELGLDDVRYSETAIRRCP